MSILDWVTVGAGSVTSATCSSRLYTHRFGRRLASSESKAAWYWLGMSMICVLCTLSVLARGLHHDAAAWAALSAACAIACTNVAVWVVSRIRGERSRHCQDRGINGPSRLEPGCGNPLIALCDAGIAHDAAPAPRSPPPSGRCPPGCSWRWWSARTCPRMSEEQAR